MDVYRDTWRRAGLDLPDDLLHEILDAEQQCWDRAVRVDPDALQRPVVARSAGHQARGLLERAVPARDDAPPGDVATESRELVDAVLFSSQVGRRKPAPEIYRGRARRHRSRRPTGRLFVGDRVREDYEGPRAVGMRAVICTAHADGDPAATASRRSRRWPSCAGLL